MHVISANKARLKLFRNPISLYFQLRQFKANIIAVLMLLLLASCGGGGGSSSSAGPTPASVTLTAITISPGTQTVPMGVYIQYAATGTYSDGSTRDITNQVAWSAESAQNVLITASGLAVGTANDSAIISASLSGITAYAHLTITAASVVSIAVTPPDRSIAIGATLQYTATSTNSDGSTTVLAAVNLVWASSNPGIATITSAGLASGVSTGSTTISATFAGNIVGSTGLTITSVAPTSLAVTFAGGTTMPTGATQLANATVTFSDGSTQVIPASQISWSSTDTSVATIDTSGNITSIMGGTSTILASYLAVSGRTVLTVKAATLVSLAVNSLSPNGIIPILVGETNRLIATGTYNANDGSAQFTFITNNASWSSTDPSLMTVSSTGTATAIAVGTPVSIRAVLNGIISAIGVASPNNNTFNVIPSLRLMSISVTPQNTALNGASGLQQQFTATGTYADGSTANITNVATWTSSVTTLATVTTAGNYSGGLATVVATAVSAFGPTTITASFSTGTVPTTSSATLVINPARVVSIAITPNVASGLVSVPTGGTLPGYIGLAYPLKAIATFTDGTNQDVTNMATWATGTGTAIRIGNSPSLTATDGTPSAAGNKGVAYVLIASGTSTNITAALGGATSPNYMLASSAATIIPTSIAVSPVTTKVVESNTLPATPGLQQQYKAIAVVPASGGVLAGSYDVTNCTTTGGWTSTTPAMASIGNNPSPNTSAGSISGNAGLVTVVSTIPGSTNITESVAGRTSSPAVTVTIGTTALSSIAITPTPTSPATMFYMPNNPFATKVFTATGTYMGGTGAGTYDLTQLGGWTSSNPAVESISIGSDSSGTSPLYGGGIATVISSGTTNIGYTLGSVSATPVAVKVQ